MIGEYVPCYDCIYQAKPGELCKAPLSRERIGDGNYDIKKVRNGE